MIGDDVVTRIVVFTPGLWEDHEGEQRPQHDRAERFIDPATEQSKLSLHDDVVNERC